MPGAGAYNGVYRGVVVDPPAGFSGLWVVVARLNGAEPMGPCEVIHSPMASATDPASGDSHTHTLVRQYEAGDKVIVATIAGIKDDLVVLGPAGNNPAH